MLIVIAVTGIVLFGLLGWFYSLEEDDNRHMILIVLVCTLLAEALLAGPAAEVPVGILRPRVFGQDFRPPDAVILAALAARVLSVRGTHVSRLAVGWMLFLLMYTTGVAVGLLEGIPYVEVLFQGKAVFYLIGGMTIASGADVMRVYQSTWRLGYVLAALVPIAVVLEAINFNISVSTPVQDLNRLGRLSNDTVTLITLVGVLVILTEATRPNRRLKVGIAALLLLLAPAAGHQRASYLVLLAILLAFGVLSFGKTWSRRATVTPVEMGLIGTGMLGLVVLGFLITSSPGVIIGPVQDAFGGEAEERSAAARISLVDQAIEKIGDSPVIGSGVGTKVIRKAELSNKEVEAAAHNVFLDVTMRIGFVGLFLFLGALWSTASHGGRIWRRARDNITASVAAAGTIIVFGVLTKGMVEPALDKFRLSLSMGIGIGLVMAALRQFEADGPDERFFPHRFARVEST